MSPHKGVSDARRRRFYLLLLVLGLASLYAGTRFVSTKLTAPAHPLTGRRAAGIATDASWMDRAGREGEEAPDRALQLIDIRPSAIVADVGAGTGYITMRLARLVGPGGKVYATDIQPGLLRILQRKAETEHLSNIEIVQGTETDVHVPDRTLDLALLVDVYHEFRQPREMLSSIRRALKIDGRLVIVEYRKEDPTIPIADTHRMSEADIRTEVQAERFIFDSTIEELPRQHIVVFRKTSA